MITSLYPVLMSEDVHQAAQFPISGIFPFRLVY